MLDCYWIPWRGTDPYLGNLIKVLSTHSLHWYEHLWNTSYFYEKASRHPWLKIFAKYTMQIHFGGLSPVLSSVNGTNLNAAAEPTQSPRLQRALKWCWVMEKRWASLVWRIMHGGRNAGAPVLPPLPCFCKACFLKECCDMEGNLSLTHPFPCKEPWLLLGAA